MIKNKTKIISMLATAAIIFSSMTALAIETSNCDEVDTALFQYRATQHTGGTPDISLQYLKNESTDLKFPNFDDANDSGDGDKMFNPYEIFSILVSIVFPEGIGMCGMCFLPSECGDPSCDVGNCWTQGPTCPINECINTMNPEDYTCQPGDFTCMNGPTCDYSCGGTCIGLECDPEE